MSAPLLVLRVGYMERYDGPGTITGGGAYIAENGVGGEVFNFMPSRGKCYGYAMSRHFAGINLRNLDTSRKWARGDELDGVDVVFIAKHPDLKRGQVVVGWYRNATVYHQHYRVRWGVIPGMVPMSGVAPGDAANDTRRQYLCVANAADAHLLPEEDRRFEVPYAPAGYRGFPGQSNVWYPALHNDAPDVHEFAKRLQAYIASSAPAMPLVDEEPGDSGGGARSRKSIPDQAHNAAVEAAAVAEAVAFYEAEGYRVVSVESESKGWDLEATKDGHSLYIEVKGTARPAIYFELTPNEYLKLQQNASRFRVCVVCDALGAPQLFDLRPSEAEGDWQLRSEAGDILVPLVERVAAVGAEVRVDERSLA